jgi:hypothetical protein
MKRRLLISCHWCKDGCRADSYEDLRHVYGRHLRNCNALNRMFVAGRYATGAPFTKEQVIDGILQRSGLHPEGQKIQAERELAALRQQISEDPELTPDERAELLAEVDRNIGTVPHEATGQPAAPVPDQVEVTATPDPIAAVVLELAKGAANTDLVGVLKLPNPWPPMWQPPPKDQMPRTLGVQAPPSGRRMKEVYAESTRDGVAASAGMGAQLEVLAAHEFITAGTARLNEILGNAPGDLKQVVLEGEPTP